MTTPEEVAEIVSTNGQVASSVTDHGTLGSFIRFQKAAKKQGIKPIFGVEAYFVDDVNRENADDKRERYHLILLAKNDLGLKNLFGINKVAWTEQFYYKPLIDFNTLEKFNDGIICLSGCMGSAVSQAILDNDEQRAEQLVKRFHNLFGGDYYLEIQPHNPKELNTALIEYGDSLGIPIVGTLDCHFPTKQDQGIEEVLLMSGQRSSLNAADERYAKERAKQVLETDDLIDKMDILYPNRRLSFKELPLYIMSADEVLEHFAAAGITRTDILENTMEIAEKCNAEIKMNQMLLPSYTENVGLKHSSDEYLREIAFFMLEEKGLDNDEYRSRLKEELDIITQKNFSDYFLILWDLVTWADSQKIARGMARGSAGGSLLAFVLNITGIDPVKHGLLFFRFINPERNDFPDIDLDFEDKRRDEAKEYLRQRWGEENVAGVAAYGTFKAKGAVKDIASVLCVPYNEANKMTSLFEDIPEYKSSPKLAEFRKKYPEIEKIVERLEGRYKLASAHAAGVVVSKVPISHIAPIEMRKEANTGRKIEVVAYDKDEVGEFGLIKLDALSVRAVSVIKDCVNMIKKRYGIDVTKASQDVDNPDEKVFENFSAGNVVGIFQAEGAGYANLIQEMGIRDFPDLVASNALVRPGSYVTQGKTYLAVRDGSKRPRYEHEILKNILEETYGTYIFEEQVMRIAVELAGFSWAKADHLRKIISKKKDQKAFDTYREDFLSGAERYIERHKADALWKQIEKASLYMFNKCLTGDTIIYRPQKSRYAEQEITLAELWGQWHNGKASTRAAYRRRGLKIWAMKDGRIKLGTVRGVYKNGVKPVWRVTLENGMSIKTTSNHRHMTVDGWKEVGNINIGDRLLVDGGPAIHQYIKNGGGRGWGKDTQNRREASDGRFRPAKFNYTLKQQVKLLPECCQFCGSEDERLEVAHLDQDRTNNSLDNLRRLCGSCHKQYDIDCGARNKRWATGREVVDSAVISIEYVGEEMTYDLEMEDEGHNFVANGIITHNSHATAYSIISYQTMWLKVNYPLEFIWATLYNEKEPEKITTYIFEAKRMGLEVDGPDINLSEEHFSLGGNKIRFGLSNISGVGHSAVTEIVDKRPFSSFEEFTEKTIRSRVRKNNIENLEKVGCFESLGHAPYEKERYFGPVLNWYKNIDEKTPYDDILTPCAIANSNKETTEIYLVKGVVKNTKRTPSYFRIEIEDSSGVFSSFVDKDAEIKKRDYIIACVGDQTVLHFEDFNDIDAGSNTRFADFLRWQVKGNEENPYEFIYNHGVSKTIGVDKNTPFLCFVLKTVFFKTKKGREMASIYTWIPDVGWAKFTAFEHVVRKRRGRLEQPLQWALLKAKYSNGYLLEDIISAEEWVEKRKERLNVNS